MNPIKIIIKVFPFLLLSWNSNVMAQHKDTKPCYNWEHLFVKISFLFSLAVLMFACDKSGIGTPVPQRPLENMPKEVVDQYYAFPKNDTLIVTGYSSNNFHFEYYESDLKAFTWGGAYRNSFDYRYKLKNVAKNAYKLIVTPDMPVNTTMLNDNYITFRIVSTSYYEPFPAKWRMIELKY